MDPDPLLTRLPYADASAFPKPRFKLWRTLFKNPRPTRRLAPTIPFNPLTDMPAPDVAAHWGEHILIEDTITVLHRDGTITTRQRLVSMLNGAAELAGWDEFVRTYDARRETPRRIASHDVCDLVGQRGPLLRWSELAEHPFRKHDPAACHGQRNGARGADVG